MKKSMFFAALVLGASSFAFATDSDHATRPVFVGGHEPTRQFRDDPIQYENDAPYALTGADERADAHRPMQEVRVGSRIVAYIPVSE